jgi:GxxExxY protein
MCAGKKVMDIEEVAKSIVDAAVKVHRALGPGLLESAYQQCLTYELSQRNLQVECEVLVPVTYENVTLDAGYRADMIVEGCIIIENKTVDQIAPIHEAQLITYLKLSNLHLGFLLNWNVSLMKHGIKRIVFKLPEREPIKITYK